MPDTGRVHIDAIADRDANTDELHLSDCEGELKIWRVSALRNVSRDDTGRIVGFRQPSSYRPSDLIFEADLDTWDEGEDDEDDRIRATAADLVQAREDRAALLAEARNLTSELERARADLALARGHVDTYRQGWRELHREVRRLDRELGAARREGGISDNVGDQIDALSRPDEESPVADACDRCEQPFDPTDTRFDGSARHKDTPWCRRCVDRCHEAGADHTCPICRPVTEEARRG